MQNKIDYNGLLVRREISADDLIANWQAVIDRGLRAIQAKHVDTSVLLWIGALANLWRGSVKTIINNRRDQILALGHNHFDTAYRLDRDRGYGERSHSLTKWIGKADPELVDRALKASQHCNRVNELFESANLLFSQSMDLARERIKAHIDTTPAKRLRFDANRVAFLITWLDHGKWGSELENDSLFGWKVSNGIGILHFIRHLNRQVRIQRGCKYRKGDPRATWKQCCDDWRSFRYRDVDYVDRKRDRQSNAARGWLHKLGIFGSDCNSADIADYMGIAYRVYMDHGIRQNVIARWLRSKGIRMGSIYPRIIVVGQPVTIDDPNGLTYYAIPCVYDDRSNYGSSDHYAALNRQPANPDWVVFADGMTDVYHVSRNDIRIGEITPLGVSVRPSQLSDQARIAVEKSKEAIARRIESDRRERERVKLSELSARVQLARLIRKCRRIPAMDRDSSYRVGNCKPGTAAFIERLGLSDRDVVTGYDIAQRWKANGYCERSYFQRVINGFPDSAIVVNNAEAQ